MGYFGKLGSNYRVTRLHTLEEVILSYIAEKA
jgi:hypothetical protein